MVETGCVEGKSVAWAMRHDEEIAFDGEHMAVFGKFHEDYTAEQEAVRQSIESLPTDEKETVELTDTVKMKSHPNAYDDMWVIVVTYGTEGMGERTTTRNELLDAMDASIGL